MNILTKYVLNTIGHCNFAPKNCKQFAQRFWGNVMKQNLPINATSILAECAVRGGQRNELMQQRWKMTDSTLCGMWVSLLLPPAFTQQLLQSLRDSSVLVTQKHLLYSQRDQVALNYSTYAFLYYLKTWQIITDSLWFKFCPVPLTKLFYGFGKLRLHYKNIAH